jgi:PAS domain S-box-containing protein
VAVSLAVYLHPSPLNLESILFFIVPIILAGTFLPFSGAVLCVIVNLGTIVAITLVVPELDLRQILVGPFGIVALSSGILLASYRYRNLLEQDRQLELAEREVRYRCLFETAFEAVAVQDGLTILEYNSGFAHIFGYRPEEPLRMPWLAFLAPQSHDEVMRMLSAGMTAPCETLGQRKDGSLFHIELITKAHTHNGRPANLIAVRDISARKRIEAQLRASLDEKEVLLKEIHHRVKNNLQVISSLLNLQAASVQDANLLAHYQDSQNRIRSMALIHEQLYRSDDLARIDFGRYLDALTATLGQTYRRQPEGVTLQVEADTVLLDVDAAIPCGLLVNELVSNALKHAFPDGRKGTVEVQLRREVPGQLRLMVRDDGVGFPAGVDYRSTMSLGLQLVNSLARQLGATVEMHSGPGTTFELRLSEGAPTDSSPTNAHFRILGPHKDLKDA